MTATTMMMAATPLPQTEVSLATLKDMVEAVAVDGMAGDLSDPVLHLSKVGSHL